MVLRFVSTARAVRSVIWLLPDKSLEQWCDTCENTPWTQKKKNKCVLQLRKFCELSYRQYSRIRELIVCQLSGQCKNENKEIWINEANKRTTKSTSSYRHVCVDSTNRIFKLGIFVLSSQFRFVWEVPPALLQTKMNINAYEFALLRICGRQKVNGGLTQNTKTTAR